MKNGMIEKQQGAARDRLRARKRRAQAAALRALALLGANARADPNADQAVRMYNRIAGVPPSAPCCADDAAPDPVTAALIATNDPAFYNDTIRNLAAPWTNRDQSVFVPLNDYTATVVGMVRDNVPFNTLLSADLVYIASPSASSANNLPAYSPATTTCIRRWTPTTSTCRRPGVEHAVGDHRNSVGGHRRRDDDRGAAARSSSTARTARCSASP
jgi:hypothetical protein